MIDRHARDRDGHDAEVDATEQRPVGLRDFAPPCVPHRQVAQLDPQDRPLQPVHPAVSPHDIMLVFLPGPAMVADLAHPRRHVGTGGDHGARIATRPQILAGVEAEAAGQGRSARRLPSRARPLRLGRVFDYGDPVPRGNRHHRRHIDAAAVEMDRDDGPGARRDRRFQQRHIHEQGLRIDVDEAGQGAAADDRLGGRRERVRDRDHLIACANPDGAESQFQRVGAVGTGNRLAHAAVVGELRLEPRDLVPQDEIRGGEDAIDGRLQLGSQ